MAFKVLAFACFVAAAQAGILAPVAHYAAPVYKVAAPVAHYAPHQESYAPVEYNFEYSVHDEHTGDIKSQKEVRHGDQVQGSYSLIEADGSRRVVEYTADEHAGFNAVVHNEPGQHAAYKPSVKVIAPVAHYAAPVQSYYH